MPVSKKLAYLLYTLGILVFGFEGRINAKEEFSLEVGRDAVGLHFGRKLRLIELEARRP